MDAADDGDVLPFPDLTGLRSRTNDRHKSEQTVLVEQRVTLSHAKLDEAVQRVDQGLNWQDVLVAAWTVVLVHLLASEDRAATRSLIRRNGQCWAVHFHLKAQDRASWKRQIEAIDVCALLRSIQSTAKSIDQNQQATVAETIDNGITFDTVAVDGRMSCPVRLHVSTANGDDQALLLSLYASVRVHTLDSARLHLQQVVACLESICGDLLHQQSKPAFSPQRFPSGLLASDGKPRQITDDFSSDAIEAERLEFQFERRAKVYADRIALDFRADLHAHAGQTSKGNVRLSYREVDRLSSSIALIIQAHIQSVSYHATPTVALCLDKSHWTYLAIMAVLKSGAAWCPIDNDWPIARQEALLAKSGARVVLTAGDRISQSLEEVRPRDMKVVRLDALNLQDIDPTLQSTPSTATTTRTSSEDLAYLIWTSGTTGLPKAVGIQHKAAVQALRALQRVIPFDKDDTSTIRYLQFSAYNFDLMILDMFYTWGLGGTLCSSTRTILLTNLVDIANAFKATHTLLTPAIMAMTPRNLIPSLNVVINGGEKLSQIVADIWSVDCCLLNLYGPAEATLIAMHRRVPPNDQVKAPNIGRALYTTSCHAIDENDNVVIKGAVGQLVLGGYQCALGYMGDPVKTADKFVHHPTLGRVYKTGDMVRQLWNGDFEYLGRADDQVKINGIRIELLEINATLRAASQDVKDSETLVMPLQQQHESSDVQIVNFCVVPSNLSPASQLIRTDDDAVRIAFDLITYARANLPSYMVPALFVIVEYFPKTSSAKIDREVLRVKLASIDILEWQNRLASYGAAKDDIDDTCQEKVSTEEAQLQRCIAEICRITSKQVGRHTPFPQLGLDSIRAIALSRSLNAKGISLSVVDIINENTLARLAERAARKTPGEEDREMQIELERFDQKYRKSDALALVQDEIARVLPATPLQEALIAETMQDESRYWLHRMYAIPMDTVAGNVETAIRRTLDRFEILRTFLLPVVEKECDTGSDVFGVNFIQVVLKSSATADIIELDDVNATNDNEAITLLAAQKHNFNVSEHKPLVRFTVIAENSKLIMHIHHALYDQISLDLIGKELFSNLKGQGSESLPKTSSFAKALPYVLVLSKTKKEENLNTWKELLKIASDQVDRGDGSLIVAPPRLSFTRDESQPRSSKIETFKRRTSLSYERAIHSTQNLSSSLRPIMQVALAVLLSRLCETSTIILGDAVSGRALSASLDDVVGPVLFTMPVPIAIESNRSFQQLCQSLSQFHKRAMSNAHIALTDVRRLLQLPRSSELFHALFVFEPPPSLNEQADEARGREALVEGDFGIAVEHDMAFEVAIGQDDVVTLTLNARTGVTDEGMAMALLTQYEDIIMYMISNAQGTPKTMKLEHSKHLNFETNGTHALAVSDYSPSKFVQDELIRPAFSAFMDLARVHPARVAVECHSMIPQDEEAHSTTVDSLTYGQLDEISSRLAGRITRLCANSQSVVAVTLPRSLWTYIALLGILKAGCVYLPIDESLPMERKKLLLESSKATCLISHSSTAWSEGETSDKVQVLMVPNDANFSEEGEAFTSPTSISSGDPAYILYTSGSTGKPKGCMLTHGNLSAALASFRLTYEEHAPGSLASNVRFLARSIESFDVALLEALLPLQSGGTIVTAPRHVLLANLGQAMAMLRVTHAAVVPSLFYMDGRRPLPDDLPCLRALIVGGERIQRDILDAWAASSVPLLNAYGPTEACIGSSIARLLPHDSISNIGKPFASTQYIVLREHADEQDTTIEIAMRGETGELAIAGLQIGSYIDGTEEKHMSSFCEVNGLRVYRTGDQVRMWADDTIEYLGRIESDSQVKVRGVRVELGEVDAAILHGLQNASPLSNVRIKTQLLNQSALRTAQMITFVAPGTSLDSNENVKLMQDRQAARRLARSLLESAKANLPKSMVPSMIVPLQSLPLATLSGKIDVKKLSVWFTRLSDGEVQSIRSLSDTSKSKTARTLNKEEAYVKGLICRLFQVVEHFNFDTDLFALGLDSLNVTVLCGYLAKECGKHVDIGQIMANATVESIAKAIHEEPAISIENNAERNRANWAELLRIVRKQFIAGKAGMLYAMPCLPTQASMISQSLLDLQSVTRNDTARVPLRYVNVLQVKVKGTNADRLSEAIERALRRHDIYRTVFIEVSNTFCQAVLNPDSVFDIRFTPQDGRNWGAAAQRSILQKIECVPPLRYHISACHSGTNGIQEVVLDLAIHHALYDSNSLGELLNEVVAEYTTGSAEISTRESSFQLYMQNVFGASEEERSIDYWKAQLANVTINHFPCLTGRKSDITSTTAEAKETTLSLSLSDIRSAAKQASVTIAMFVLHAFAQLYSRYTADESVLIGLVLNGRDLTSTPVHGPCVNTVPFGVRLHHDKSLQNVKSAFSGALQHQHVPLTRLSRQLGLPLRQELFNVLFSFVGESDQMGNSGDYLQELTSDMSTGYPLALEVETSEKDNRLLLRLVYNTGHISEKQAAILLQQVSLIANSNAPGGASNPSVDAELYAVENVDASQRPIHHFVDLFAKQVSIRPDCLAFKFATSLEGGSQDLVEGTTYADLDELSDRLARSLLSLADPGAVIGVCMSQCAEVYPLLLAIWKASMTYLPLDPKLPSERLNYIIATAEPSLFVAAETQSATQAHSLDNVRHISYTDLLQASKKSVPQAQGGRKSFSSQATLDRPAYIMFTSGSSGKPKGVEVSQRALGAALASWKSNLPYTPGRSCMLQLASPGFDVFLIEVCMPLAFGFTFASAPKEVLLDDLEQTFHRLNITIADLPAALAVTIDPRNLPPLEWLMSGGDQLDQRVLDAWCDFGLINAWGPTETTIGNTLGFVRHKVASRSWIGYAYPTSTMLVLEHDADEHAPAQVALRGCIGELAVAGPQLATGYIKNADLTRQKFVETNLPFEHSKCVRVYRTGDRGRILSDGSIECLGRIDGDGQVKINSQRVELKEIEVVLRQDAEVSDALVLYLKHPAMSSKQLIAFLVVTNDGKNDGDLGDLRLDKSRRAIRIAHDSLVRAANHLPAYMVPRHSLVMSSPALPLTSNDKVDTHALKAFFSALDVNSIQDADTNGIENSDNDEWAPMELILRKAVADFALVEESMIGRSMSFYRLGIDSISSFQLAKFLRSSGFASVLARDILALPSIALLAKSIELESASEEHGTDMSITLSEEESGSWRIDEKDRIECVLPCTPLQQGMLLEALASKGQLYVHHHLFKLENKAGGESVIFALSNLIKDHAMLRTSFHLRPNEYGAFVQAIHSSVRVDAKTIDVSCDPQELELTVQQFTRAGGFFTNEEALAKPPIALRFFTNEHQTILDLVIHHALYDGESLEILIEQLNELASHPKERNLLPSSASFRSTIPFLLSSPTAAQYWVDHLVTRLDTLIDHPLEDQSSSSSCHLEEIDLASINASSLTTFAAECGVTTHVVALFAFAKLLASLTGQLDVTFAQLFSLRDAANDGAQTMIGPCFNACLTSISLSHTDNVEQYLQKLQSKNDESRPYRNASLADVQRKLTSSARGAPMRYDALFNMQKIGNPSSAKRHPYLLPYHVALDKSSESGATQYTLNVELVQSGEKLSVVATAHTKRFSKQELQHVVQQFEEILCDIVQCGANARSTNLPSNYQPLVEQDARQASKIMQAPLGRTTTHTIGNGHAIPPRPDDALHETLTRTMREMFKLPSNEPLDTSLVLASYGLDSIALMTLASLLRKQGIRAGVIDIVQGRSIDGIEERLRQKQDMSNNSTSREESEERIHLAAHELGVKTDQIQAVVDTLPGQDFEIGHTLHGSTGREGFYTFFYRFSLGREETHGVKLLQDAWDQVRRRRAILRTSFVALPLNHAGESIRRRYQQVIWAPANVATHSSIEVTMSKHSLEDMLMSDNGLAWFEDRMDIDESLRLPPNACHIFIQEGNGNAVLALRLHHALYDAWSLPLIMDDIRRAYAHPHAFDLPDDMPHYKAFVNYVAQRKDDTKEQQVAKTYWSMLFRDVEPFMLGSGRMATKGDGAESFAFLQDCLKNVAHLELALRSKRVTLPSLILACLASVLSNDKKQDPVTFGVYRQGRSSAYDHVERVVGNCMSILPIVQSVSGVAMCSLAQSMQAQLDDQRAFEDTCSIDKILQWTERRDIVPWNLYVNLLWPKTKHDGDVKRSSALFEPMTNIMTRDYHHAQQHASRVLHREQEERASLPRLRMDVNIDVQLDPISDSIHFGVRWTSSILSRNQVETIVKAICALVRRECDVESYDD